MRKCTRQTTQKIEILTNNDQTVRGNINYLMSRISNCPKDNDLIELINDIFELKQQQYLSEKSLWHRKRIYKRVSAAPVIITDDEIEISELEYKNIFRSNYSKASVKKYMENLFTNSEMISTADLEINNDEEFIMSALGIINSDDPDSFYKFEYQNENVIKSNYSVPNIIFTKRR